VEAEDDRPTGSGGFGGGREPRRFGGGEVAAERYGPFYGML
jgi:hypothetical protein